MAYSGHKGKGLGVKPAKATKARKAAKPKALPKKKGAKK